MADDALRRLERQVQSEPGDARAWAALAAERARVDREEDALRAAWRAARLEPRSPARELIPPTTARAAGQLVSAAPWRGARFGTVRELPVAPPARMWTQLVDLGRGRVAYDTSSALTAVDLVTGDVVWSRPTARSRRARWGFALPLLAWREGARVLERVDPISGETVAELRFDGAPEQAACLGSEDVVAFVEHGPVTHDSPPAVPRISTFDLRTGAALGRFEGPRTRRTPRVEVTRDRLVLSDLESYEADRPGVIAFDLAGREVWRAPEARGLGVVDERVLVTGPTGSRALDLVSGREVATSPPLAGSVLCATPGELVVGDEKQALVLDRRSLVPLWSAGAGFSGVGTREALMWTWHGPSGSCVLLSRDARTYASHGQIVLECAAHASLGLVAQHLVLALHRADGEPAGPLRVIELLDGA